MDAEFHYYMTYLIAVKGKFRPEQAKTIAYASQYVDDNDMIFHIDKGVASSFINYISQTMNILKPKNKLLRIYPVFHFMPGDPSLDAAQRRDGLMHWLNCTPNSDNAQTLFDASLKTEDLYRIGIATHAYADTWAHQNFTGTFCEFNSTFLESDFAIGHAQAGHNPDEPALVWKDSRLLQPRIDNRKRFLSAAKHILLGYLSITEPTMAAPEIDALASELQRDLDTAIGLRDQGNHYRADRIARYKALSESPAYGSSQMPEYDEDHWFDAAISENVRGLRDRKLEMKGFDLSRFDPWTDQYHWADPDNYKKTAWYRFQEQVIRYQKDAMAHLKETSFRKIDIDAILKLDNDAASVKS